MVAHSLRCPTFDLHVGGKTLRRKRERQDREGGPNKAFASSVAGNEEPGNHGHGYGRERGFSDRYDLLPSPETCWRDTALHHLSRVPVRSLRVVGFRLALPFQGQDGLRLNFNFWMRNVGEDGSLLPILVSEVIVFPCPLPPVPMPTHHPPLDPVCLTMHRLSTQVQDLVVAALTGKAGPDWYDPTEGLPSRVVLAVAAGVDPFILASSLSSSSSAPGRRSTWTGPSREPELGRGGAALKSQCPFLSRCSTVPVRHASKHGGPRRFAVCAAPAVSRCFPTFLHSFSLPVPDRDHTCCSAGSHRNGASSALAQSIEEDDPKRRCEKHGGAPMAAVHSRGGLRGRPSVLGWHALGVPGSDHRSHGMLFEFPQSFLGLFETDYGG